MKDRLADFFDDHVVAILFAVFVLLVVTVPLVGWRLDIASCHRQADRLGTEWLHDAWGEGCYLRMDDGRFVPAGRYRTVVGGE